MKQKRSATQSFLIPCDNDCVKKQRVAHCGGLEALKELDDNVASMKQCINHHGGSEAVEVWLCLNKSNLEPFLYFSFFFPF
ncbi:hypothetical protein BDA96_10G026400 [Sorghum bicolor]|uniref:Uncharacterized protein n=1 Tax=Sorghum bicolor TaxID=4558 RepID=A0A921TY29_SORBI|nr:hypothetical protein BDA96_10G026400 [Sorghum bicolor]